MKVFGYWEEDMEGNTCGTFVVSSYQPEFFANCEEFFNDDHPIVGAWDSKESVQAKALSLGLNIELEDL